MEIEIAINEIPDMYIYASLQNDNISTLTLTLITFLLSCDTRVFYDLSNNYN